MDSNMLRDMDPDEYAKRIYELKDMPQQELFDMVIFYEKVMKLATKKMRELVDILNGQE